MSDHGSGPRALTDPVSDIAVEIGSGHGHRD